MEKICPDTSIIVDRKISEILKRKKKVEIIIPVAVLEELQAQASKGREPGFIGLDELKTIQKICKRKKIKIKFVGERPNLEDIKLAKSGRIDAIIRDVAKAEKAVLYTSDYVQALVAEAEGVKVKYFAPEVKLRGLKFEDFFTADTISIHLKENVPPFAKKGKPGKFKLVKIGNKPLDEEELNKIVEEIIEAVRVSEEGSIEISRSGATVIQLREYRIAVTKPPFSDGIEITIVKPIVKLKLEDYRLSKKLMKRLEERAEGILITGPPGSGKSSFASALAEFYFKKGKIVKTLESPRDLQVMDEITQYGPLEGDFEKTADILLLVRPDYSVFDEIRKSKDFQVFTDLRLAGVGMVGVIHASNPIDAIQRFIGKVELGIIPHLIDTIIFLKDGEIKDVYELNLTVKVPTGMTESDLARPVVEVKDFESGELKYEIYTFGEENVVVPVKKGRDIIKKLAEEKILDEVKRFDRNAEVDIISNERAVIRVDNRIIPRIIGKNGETISKLERKLGISLTVEPRIPSLGKEINFKIDEIGNSIEFSFPKNLMGKIVSIFIKDNFLFSATIGKKGKIKVSKKSKIGKELLEALAKNEVIRVFI